MSSRRQLERRLSHLAGFEDPTVDLEQYPTPADLAAHVVHFADLQGDIVGRTVVDLGAGTGVLALAAATRGPERVLGVEVDPSAIRTARENACVLEPGTGVEWIQGDATRPPFSGDRMAGPTTVVMNPPFGAQTGREHADRAFLVAGAQLASVSYSIHNAGSRTFVESFTEDEGGRVTHAFEADFDVRRQFAFHDSERETLTVEIYRIEWS